MRSYVGSARRQRDKHSNWLECALPRDPAILSMRATGGSRVAIYAVRVLLWRTDRLHAWRQFLGGCRQVTSVPACTPGKPGLAPDGVRPLLMWRSRARPL